MFRQSTHGHVNTPDGDRWKLNGQGERRRAYAAYSARRERTRVMGVDPDGTSLRFLPPLTGEGQDGGERFCLLPILLPPSPSPAQRAREGIYEQLLKGVPFQPDPICRWPNGLRFCSQAVQYRLADGGQTFDVRYVAKFVIKRHLHFRRVDRHLETAVRRILVARRYIPANHGGL